MRPTLIRCIGCGETDGPMGAVRLVTSIPLGTAYEGGCCQRYVRLYQCDTCHTLWGGRMILRQKRRVVPRMAKPRQQPESPILHDCLVWLLDHGYFVWRNQTGACKVGQRWLRFGYKGSGDIIGMTRAGTFLSVEVKSERGILSPDQVAFAGRVRASGGIAITVRSVDDLVREGL